MTHVSCQPLEDVAVVEVGEGVAVGYAGKLLVDMGAAVVKIESPIGDATRRQGPYEGDIEDPERSGTFAYLNAGKQSVVLDEANGDSAKRVQELLGRAQLILHAPSFAAATPQAFRGRYPGSVVVTVGEFGRGTSFEQRAATDLTVQAASAISLGIGLRGRAPLKLPGDQSAFQAGLCAAIAAVSALSTGGALIDIAAADIWATLYNGGEVANDYFGRKKQPRAGYRVSRQPYLRAIFPCKDGFFAIQCTETRHWLAFLQMVGCPELASHPLFVDRLKANDEYAEQCDAFFAEWFSTRTKEELLGNCLASKIPAAPVYDFRDVARHTHLTHRGYSRPLEIGDRVLNAPGNLFKGVRPEPQDKMVAPRLGAHSTTAQFAPREKSPARETDAIRPLRGIRVADFGWVWAGAIPGHILADLGAEVIRIESRKPLDFMRQGRPIVGREKDPEQNPVFQNVNRGKLSLCINLNEAGAAEIAKQLISRCDVVIENFSPGVMERFGLGWKDLQAIKPDLIMCSMSAAGQTGPLSGIRTYAAMIAGLAGINSMVGYPGERVLGIQAPPYADPNAGLHATFAVLCALQARHRSKEGTYIDLSQWEAAVNVMGPQVIDYELNGRVPGTCATRDTGFAPNGHYPVLGEDKWIAIAAATDEQWRALSSALGNPPWMFESEFRTPASRRDHVDSLDENLARETRGRDGDALAAALQSARVPAEVLLDVDQVLRHPYFKARDLFELVEHPTLKQVPVYRLPWKVNGASISVTRRAPMIGEHTQYVLGTLLGKSEAEIDALKARAIVE